MSDEHQSFIKSPRQLIVIVALAFIVPIVVITLIATLVQTTPRTGTGADAMTPEAIAQRLAPIGRLEVDATAGEADASPDSAAAESQPADSAPAAPAGAPPAAEAAPAAPAAPAAEAAPAQARGGDIAAGAKVYKTTCAVCHDAGVAGAPKHGDAAAWKPRLEQGFDVLVKHSIDGIRAMPPRGGNAKLTDEEMRDSVAYMLDAVQ